jgi:hypothetical protein
MGRPVIRKPTTGAFADGELVHYNDASNAAELLSNVDSTNVVHRSSVRRAVMSSHVAEESGVYHVKEDIANSEHGAFLIHRVSTSCTLLRFWFVKYGELAGSATSNAEGIKLSGDSGGPATGALYLNLYVVPQYEAVTVAASSTISAFGTLVDYPFILNAVDDSSIYALEKRVLVDNQVVTVSNVPYHTVWSPASATTIQTLGAGDLVILQLKWSHNTGGGLGANGKSFYGPVSAVLYLEEDHI